MHALLPEQLINLTIHLKKLLERETSNDIKKKLMIQKNKKKQMLLIQSSFSVEEYLHLLEKVKNLPIINK